MNIKLKEKEINTIQNCNLNNSRGTNTDIKN